MRGLPRNNDALGSPHRHLESGGSRPGYGRTQTSTAYPVTYPVNPSHSSHGYSAMGTISRSASRARMPLPTPKPARDEDDEEEVVDRGADLIKRRQRERKQARKKKEQERRKAEGGVTPAITPGLTPNPSAPPSGIPGEAFGGQQDRLNTERSGSRSRAASSVNPDGSESYFSSSWSSSVTPHGHPSPRDHPASIYSSTADDDEEDEEDARTSIINEVIHDVVEEAEEDEEDEDEEDNGGDDEGVTLKDRQDVSTLDKPSLITGDQYRTSIRSTHLETGIIPQDTYRHSKRRISTPRCPISSCRASFSTRQYPMDIVVWLVACNRLSCGSPTRQRSRSPRRWERRIRQNTTWTRVVYRLALWQVCRRRRRSRG